MLTTCFWASYSLLAFKDRDDLRMLAPQLDKETITRRWRATTQDLLAVPGLREKAEQNWYIIYGESLPR